MVQIQSATLEILSAKYNELSKENRLSEIGKSGENRKPYMGLVKKAMLEVKASAEVLFGKEKGDIFLHDNSEALRDAIFKGDSKSLNEIFRAASPTEFVSEHAQLEYVTKRLLGDTQDDELAVLAEKMARDNADKIRDAFLVSKANGEKVLYNLKTEYLNLSLEIVGERIKNSPNLFEILKKEEKERKAEAAAREAAKAKKKKAKADKAKTEADKLPASSDDAEEKEKEEDDNE